MLEVVVMAQTVPAGGSAVGGKYDSRLEEPMMACLIAVGVALPSEVGVE
jgi:hypothetical protein